MSGLRFMVQVVGCRVKELEISGLGFRESACMESFFIGCALNSKP